MSASKPPSASDIAALRHKAAACRRNIIYMTTQAGSGHPGPSLSIADLVTALYFREMRYDPAHPEWMERDRFVLSKGHAAPALYAALIEAGFVAPEALFHFRQVEGLLQGHPCVKTPGVDASSGSLGLGLSVACGMALGAKMAASPARVYAIIGDGESDEGQIWEAGLFAAHHHLDNLTVFTDRNMYQYDGPTSDILELEPLAAKWRSFGWSVQEIDGHDFSQILSALDKARQSAGQPHMILAHTIKGKGVSFMEGNQAFHATAPTREEAQRALEELANGD
jgi:transketolase